MFGSGHKNNDEEGGGAFEMSHKTQAVRNADCRPSRSNAVDVSCNAYTLVRKSAHLQQTMSPPRGGQDPNRQPWALDIGPH
jgi:hypothetical protein